MVPKVKMLQKLTESGVIAILRQVPADRAEELAESLVAGGVTALEVTVQTASALDTIEKLAHRLAGRAIVGAGTVLDSETARMAIVRGADFILSPSLHQGVIQTALRYGKIAIPGVMTPTEMVQAMEWGADLVKIFPAASLGVPYIKDISGPLPHIPLVPTGGVTLENVADFIQAGAAACGIGGSLVDKNLIASGSFDQINANAMRFVQEIQKTRNV